MQRYKDEPPAVRVYTVCDESKYLVVRNVPSLGCSDELLKLFSSYGPVDECKPMDAEDCEPYTDVYWLKFQQINNARFAKRKLDDSIFLGNRLKVLYAPEYESLSDAKEKLEGRRMEVVARVNRTTGGKLDSTKDHLSVSRSPVNDAFLLAPSFNQRQSGERLAATGGHNMPFMSSVSSDKEYFPSESMNRTVQLVRDKLNKSRSTQDLIPPKGHELIIGEEYNTGAYYSKMPTNCTCYIPVTMPWPWTGKAPMKKSKRSIKLFEPLGSYGNEDGLVKRYEILRDYGLGKFTATPWEEVLGGPLTRMEIKEMLKPGLSSNKQASEHSYPAMIYSNSDGSRVQLQDDLEQTRDQMDFDDYDDNWRISDSFDPLLDSVPPGLLPIDLIAKEHTDSED